MMVIVPESPPAALKCAKNRIFITRYTEKCRLVFLKYKSFIGKKSWKIFVG